MIRTMERRSALRASASVSHSGGNGLDTPVAGACNAPLCRLEMAAMRAKSLLNNRECISKDMHELILPKFEGFGLGQGTGGFIPSLLGLRDVAIQTSAWIVTSRSPSNDECDTLCAFVC
jgi:hypothetical protein